MLVHVGDFATVSPSGWVRTVVSELNSGGVLILT